MKAKLIGKVKKVAAVATGALFVGATLGMASVFASGLSSLPGPFVSSGHVNAVFVVGANAAPTDVLGAIDISAALTASAAATHSSASSGQVTIGTLALKSKSSQSKVVAANDTTFGLFSPLSSIVDISNATYTLHNGTKLNASWQESFAFSGSSTPFVNGLDVQFPSKSFAITSTLNNRNKSDVAMPLMNDTEYLIGSQSFDLLSLTAKNATFGVLYNKSDVPIPSSFTAGTSTVNLLGIAKVLTSTGSINEVEFNVNGGSTQTANLSSVSTVDKVTLTFGKTILENSTGNFLSSLDVSSATLVQNDSAANVFGFGPYNASWTTGGTSFVFTYTGKQVLTHSFSTASSFPIMDNLSTISLQPLTHVFPAATNYNVTVGTGAAKEDTFAFNAEANTTKSYDLSGNFTSGLPNVAFGTDFRGSLTSSGVGTPDLLLEHFQKIYNISSGKYVNASSEYVFPTPAHTHYWTNSTKENVIYNSTTAKGALVRLVYQLPNGVFLALDTAVTPISSNVTTHTNEIVANVTSFLNYTSSTISTPTENVLNMTNHTYSFNGYNVTFTYATFNESAATGYHYTAQKVNNKIAIKGPASTVSLGANSYGIVPGASGLFSSNGTSMATLPVDSSYLGNLKFNGNNLTYTDPLGATQTIGIIENYSTFNTNISASTKNTTANTWGDYITGVKLKTGAAAIAVPAQNYTVALAGAQTVIGQQNYTIGQTVSAGKLLGVNGISTINAGQLINSNPDMAVLDSSFTSSTNNVPVIVIGGPAVNSLADTLLNISAPVYGSSFTNLTGVGANEAVIEMFNSVAGFNKQPALWVAGYSSQGTVEASEVLAASLVGQPIVSLTGNKVVLSTSSSSYTGVTIA